jgi:hypothetical protein
MESTEAKLWDVFHPYAMRQVKRVATQRIRFVHYTTAEAATKILNSAEVWMRSSSCMADFREIDYGLECLDGAYKSKMGDELRVTLDELFEGFSDEFHKLFAGWIPHFREHTYLTCFSEHDASEDEYGRLSMWRAFGRATGVALVFNNGPFLSSSNALAVFSSPVAYFSPNQFDQQFAELVSGIATNAALLREHGRETVREYLFQAFRFAMLCTKHPGFHEEREWRCMHSPTFEPSERLKQAVEAIGGVPQPIFKVPLEDVPDKGLVGLDIPQLLDRVIVGPTQYPKAVGQAFEHVLATAGVPDPATRIRISDIPLRTVA